MGRRIPERLTATVRRTECGASVVQPSALSKETASQGGISDDSAVPSTDEQETARSSPEPALPIDTQKLSAWRDVSSQRAQTNRRLVEKCRSMKAQEERRDCDWQIQVSVSQSQQLSEDTAASTGLASGFQT